LDVKKPQTNEKFGDIHLFFRYEACVQSTLGLVGTIANYKHNEAV